MTLRVLNILGQRPDGTGSGIFLREVVKAGRAAGDGMNVVCAGYEEDTFSGLECDNVSIVRFVTDATAPGLPHAIPGMSDVMPYRSITYASMNEGQIASLCDAYAAALARLIEVLKPDVIHLHHLWVLASLARRFDEYPWVVTLHGTELKQWHNCPQHRTWPMRGIPSIAHYFCVSSEVAAEAVRLLDLPPRKVSVVGNGFNADVFRHEPDSLLARPPIILCAGKFVAWKGFAHAIRASAQIDFPHQLVILGTGTDEARKRLAETVRLSGRSDRVLFPGHLSQPEVADWMRKAAVFALPSHHEPFGLVMLEAMACGCPVVASASGGPLDVLTPDLVEAGLGELIPPLTSTAPDQPDASFEAGLAEALARFLRRPLDRTNRQLLAEKVRPRSWSRVYATQRAVYRTLTRH